MAEHLVGTRAKARPTPTSSFLTWPCPLPFTQLQALASLVSEPGSLLVELWDPADYSSGQQGLWELSLAF